MIRVNLYRRKSMYVYTHEQRYVTTTAFADCLPAVYPQIIKHDGKYYVPETPANTPSIIAMQNRLAYVEASMIDTTNVHDLGPEQPSPITFDPIKKIHGQPIFNDAFIPDCTGD